MSRASKILVTGGAGFIGSAVCRHLVLNAGCEVVNFDKLTFPNSNIRADSLVHAAGEAIVPPAVVITKDHDEAQEVADAVRRYMREDTLTPTIQSVTTMTDLLPADQSAKLALIAKIRKAVTPALIASAPQPLRENLERLAGNWDTEFVDHPESLDVDRNTRGHLGFGYGVHQCIGANLARVEMQVAFATLARRLPGLKLAVAAEELKFKDANIYGMKELPVSW